MKLRLALGVLLSCLAALGWWRGVAKAQTQQPVLHEYFPPEPEEDATLTTDGGAELSAALRTSSGVVLAPEMNSTAPPQRLYREARRDQAEFRPDRDTRRPEVEQYDSPFSPSLTPFKRVYAYDAVRDDYSLYVRDNHLAVVAVGGASQPGEEHFFGDMTVVLRPGAKVRIPTIGPGARLMKLATRPQGKFTVWRDGADNWYLGGEVSGRVRLVSELAIQRDVFASTFADTSWARLPRVPLQPSAHRRAAREVARAIGVSRQGMAPRQVVTKLVTYFRAFVATDEALEEGDDIYLDLALSKKGVCRHRAFAFLVTALNLGIQTRLVHNEAHAWVEVHDGQLWHRIDLGGAAVELAAQAEQSAPAHVPPPDELPWPHGRDSGADLAHRTRSQAEERRRESSPELGAGGSPPSRAPEESELDPEPTEQPSLDRAPASLTIDAIDDAIFRGLPVRLKGRVQAEGRGCGHIRVDVYVLAKGQEYRLGALSTDADGQYDGEVIMSRAVPPGDHELVVKTGGGGHCGAGMAQ